MKIDLSQSYGTVVGHEWAVYEQNGVLFDSQGLSRKISKKDLVIEHDGYESAKTFLKTILKGNPLAKSVIYKTAQDNNQEWNDVRTAAAQMGVLSFKSKDVEMWRLPDVI